MRSPEVAEVFARQWPRLVATLRADLGDLDLAEEAAQHAFAAASETWPERGTPDAPGAWLTTVARRWAIDQARRDTRWAQREDQVRHLIERPQRSRGTIEDDLLAMIFGCCHRALDEQSRVALTLRYVVGLSTVDIAHAFLIPEATMAKRLVRAKKKIAAAGIPFRVPDRDELDEPLREVLRIIYLVYTQGHAAPTGEIVRGDLCEEARWLAGAVCDLLPAHAETWGLAALLAFTDARRPARLDADGEVVLLADQVREKWSASAIAEGRTLLQRALSLRRIGPYQLQAAIAAAHANAATFEETDWATIRRLYAVLKRIDPSPVVLLNEAVAASLADSPRVGLELVEPLEEALSDYHYFHLARADMLARAGARAEARRAFDLALSRCGNDAERRAIRRAAELRLGGQIPRLEDDDHLAGDVALLNLGESHGHRLEVDLPMDDGPQAPIGQEGREELQVGTRPGNIRHGDALTAKAAADHPRKDPGRRPQEPPFAGSADEDE
ncbi:sigma-70 family RNA polymerase sigma factor [Microbacterium sediminicola]|uniref:Sigma-70 family RNA polymerase sigma factor n=1 Tax=Microbacterium sediminicola TaxID=415210 RepID=A0ABP4U792_9MICO